MSAWDKFIDRVIAAQRDIAKRGGAPHAFTVYVHPDHFKALEPYLSRSVLPVVPDERLGEGEIVLRHEVRA